MLILDYSLEFVLCNDQSWQFCLLTSSFSLFYFPISGTIQALESGDLAPGGVVTEGSAGSTAISHATVAPAYGCKCHVVIPDDVAIEKVCVNCTVDEHIP